MPARRGRLVRPLLGVPRADTRAYCEERGLAWHDDPANEDLRFARARVRHEVLPALRELNPAVEEAIAETSLLLRDEAEVLDRAVREMARAPFLLDELRRLPPALARLAMRAAAEEAAGHPSVLSRRDADRILDRKVPRAEGASGPVVEADGEIACVPAVAVGDRFRAGSGPVVGITARRTSSSM